MCHFANGVGLVGWSMNGRLGVWAATRVQDKVATRRNATPLKGIVHQGQHKRPFSLSSTVGFNRAAMVRVQV